MSIPLPVANADAPVVEIDHLDDLWFQVAGTICNLTCRHCFISCSPKNRTLEFLDLATVRRYLEESIRLGVKEYYFTGGEPFLNRDLVTMLEETLALGPATVLTNGTVLKRDWLERLRKAADASIYSLEFRVSIDGYTPRTNDAIRGEGTFGRILEGLRLLVKYGFRPIVTVTQTEEEQSASELVEGFTRGLAAIGYDHPRLKILPTLRIGAEAERTRGYTEAERVTPEMLEGFDTAKLVCHHSRIVTSRGVCVCPILVEAPDGVLGSTLADSLVAYPLRHQACYTCYQYGALCSNASSMPRTNEEV